MHPDGTRLISGSADRSIRLWRVPHGGMIANLTAFADRVESVATSPDGSTLVCAGAYKDPAIRLWDFENLNGCAVLMPQHESMVACLVYTPDGKMLASGSYDRTIRLWDAADRRCLAVLKGHTGRVTSLAFTADGRLLASAGGSDQEEKDSDNTVRIWRTNDGQALAMLEGHQRSIGCLRMIPGSKVLASGSSDFTVRLWSVDDLRARAELLGHTSVVSCLGTTPDGKTLASGSEDDTIRLWSLDAMTLSATPISKTTVEDITWAQEGLSDREVPEEEKRWLELLLALMRWRRRFDIALAEEPRKLAIGEFDIEIDG
jgi:WD40 repeat protein